MRRRPGPRRGHREGRGGGRPQLPRPNRSPKRTSCGGRGARGERECEARAGSAQARGLGPWPGAPILIGPRGRSAGIPVIPASGWPREQRGGGFSALSARFSPGAARCPLLIVSALDLGDSNETPSQGFPDATFQWGPAGERIKAYGSVYTVIPIWSPYEGTGRGAACARVLFQAGCSGGLPVGVTSAQNPGCLERSLKPGGLAGYGGGRVANQDFQAEGAAKVQTSVPASCHLSTFLWTSLVV